MRTRAVVEQASIDIDPSGSIGMQDLILEVLLDIRDLLQAKSPLHRYTITQVRKSRDEPSVTDLIKEFPAMMLVEKRSYDSVIVMLDEVTKGLLEVRHPSLTIEADRA